MEFLLVETDAPYLTPEPFRGRPEQIALCGVYDPQSGGDQRHHL